MTIFILVVLGILGPILVFVGLCWFVTAIRRHPYLLRIKGTVLTVDKKYDTGSDEPGVTFSPIIGYTTPEGQQVRFRSPFGTKRRIRFGNDPISPWRDGQSTDVFHDPSGVLEPCIASLLGLYGWSLGFLVGGIILLMVVVNKWNQLGGQSF